MPIAPPAPAAPPLSRAVRTWLADVGGPVDRLDYGGRVGIVAPGHPDLRAVVGTRFPLSAVIDLDQPAHVAERELDLVCLVHALAGRPDPVAAARRAGSRLVADGVLVAVEPLDGSGRWAVATEFLAEAGFRSIRTAATTDRDHVLAAARPSVTS